MRSVILITATLLATPTAATAEQPARNMPSSPPAFNTLEIAEALAGGGFQPQQAMALSHALVGISEHLQTRQETAILSAQLEIRMERIDNQMTGLSSNMRTEFARIETKIAETAATIIMWIVGVGLAVLSIGATIAGVTISVARSGTVR